MKKILLYIETIWRLGILNVAYVLWYRLSIVTKIRKLFFPKRTIRASKFIFYKNDGVCSDYPNDWKSVLISDAQKIVTGELRYYAHHWKLIGNPPNWFMNPFNGNCCKDTGKHWIHLSDFDQAIGDIKNVWEASRFEWVVTLARVYAVTGEEHYLNTLNQWINDWVEKNPVNIGANWKCGQEASIRVLNLLNAALIMEQWNHPSEILKEIITNHLERINSNILYAIVQNNNHGTSEAAALFIGGHWAEMTTSVNTLKKKFARFACKGRQWLENRIRKLVEENGSFSQHSVTYHRVLLDTLCYVELWRKKMNLAPFSHDFYAKSSAASDWLWMLTDEKSGDAPNLGSNDGAMFLNFHSCDYRDFRPSINLSQILFKDQIVYSDGLWDEPLYWFDINKKELRYENHLKQSSILDKAYAVLKSDHSWGLLRLPRYRYRPCQNDIFHFDLWFGGQNICRDAGSYSYNPEKEADEVYFQSTKAHNTVCFDDGDQMPRLGKFLLGKWITAKYISSIKSSTNRQCLEGVYRDFCGNHHHRKVSWGDNIWIIEDDVFGDFKKAEINYHLICDKYQVIGNNIVSSWGRIEVRGLDCEIALSKGVESLYYQEIRPVDILTIHVPNNKKKIVTKFILATNKTGEK